MTTLEGYYPAALAALTAPVRFVEWKALRVEGSATPGPDGIDWAPIADAGDDDLGPEWAEAQSKRSSFKEIEGRRWIYAFARPVGADGLPALVEELRIDKNGTIHATPLPPRRFDGEPVAVDDARPAEIEVGKTIRLVRRLRGVQVVHFFFATRMRLSAQAIAELQRKVVSWVPATLFEGPKHPVGPDATFGEDDPNVIPAKSIIPGALLVPVLDPLTIAIQLHGFFNDAADGLLEYVGVTPAGLRRQEKVLLARLLENVLKSYPAKRSALETPDALDKFLREYEGLAGYHAQQRDQWARYLWNWLRAEPIQFLGREHFKDPETNALSFFLPMMLSITRATETSSGRAGLAAIVADKDSWKWLHRHVIPQETSVGESYQIPRKWLLPVLEGFKEFTTKHLEHIEEVLERLGHMYEFNVGLDRGQIVLEIEKEHELAQDWHPSHGFAHGVATIVEMINLGLALEEFFEKPDVDHTLVAAGGVIDLTVALRSFFRPLQGAGAALAKKQLAFLGFASGVIDTIVAARSMIKASRNHDGGTTVGAFFTTTGSGLSAIGSLLALIPESGGSLVIAAGMLLVGLGYALIGMFRDDPLTTFLKHCEWGPWRGSGGELVEGLPELHEWKGNYRLQLEGLINLIAGFDIEWLGMRKTKFSMGWLPEGSLLGIEYEEEWERDSLPKSLNVVVFGKDGPVALNGFSFEREDEGEYLAKWRGPVTHHGDSLDKELHEIRYAARLRLKVGNQFLAIPPEPKELKHKPEDVILHGRAR